MFLHLLNLTLFTGVWCILDDWISPKFKNPYYLLHSIHNGMIVLLTGPDVYITLTDFYNLSNYQPNVFAATLVASLHLYHICMYFRKMRFDDWLHHGLMIGVALPLGVFLESSTLLGYSLFFTTGLPGGIDYFCLFAVRNGFMDRFKEKQINKFLAIWIRGPGCVSHAILTLVWVLSQPYQGIFSILSALTAILTFWNGQYFAEQVISDCVLQSSKSSLSGVE